MVLSAVPLTDTAATGTLSVATLVEEALEQCKAEMAQPSDKFDILSCTAQQRWLVSKSVEAFQTLKWRKSPASLREWSWRNLAGIHRTSDGDLPWFSADIIALNEYGKMKAERGLRELLIASQAPTISAGSSSERLMTLFLSLPNCSI